MLTKASFLRNLANPARIIVISLLLYLSFQQSQALRQATATLKVLQNDPGITSKYYNYTFETLPFPPPKQFRQYHRCNFEPLPRVLSMYDSALYLTLTNKSLARFGDYDIEILSDRPVYFQKPSDSLKEALSYVFTHYLPDLDLGLSDVFSGYSELAHNIINDWTGDRLQEDIRWMKENANYSRYYLSTLLTTPYVYSRKSYCNNIDQIYDLLRSVWKDKDLIILRGNNGQVYEYDVYDTSRSQKIHLAPRYNAWDEYEGIKAKLLEEDPSALYILAAGPISKVLAYDLAKEGRRALDLGHLAKDYDLYKKGGRVKRFWRD